MNQVTPSHHMSMSYRTLFVLSLHLRLGFPCVLFTSPHIISSLHPEDGGSKVLRNTGILPRHSRRHNPEDYDLYRLFLVFSD